MADGQFKDQEGVFENTREQREGKSNVGVQRSGQEKARASADYVLGSVHSPSYFEVAAMPGSGWTYTLNGFSISDYNWFPGRGIHASLRPPPELRLARPTPEPVAT